MPSSYSPVPERDRGSLENEVSLHTHEDTGFGRHDYGENSLFVLTNWLMPVAQSLQEFKKYIDEVEHIICENEQTFHLKRSCSSLIKEYV